MKLAEVGAIAVWNGMGFSNTRGIYLISPSDIITARERLNDLQRMNPEHSEAELYSPATSAPADVRKKAGYLLTGVTPDYTLQMHSDEFCAY